MMSLSQKIIDAAEAGDTAAQCRIATFYYKGEEVSKNLLEAEKWWRKAAEMGIPAYSDQSGHLIQRLPGQRTDNRSATLPS